MNAIRPPLPGRTRTCPHCKATILDSASVCPVCQHHLRFNPAGHPATAPAFSAFRVEGVIAPLDFGHRFLYGVIRVDAFRPHVHGRHLPADRQIIDEEGETEAERQQP